MQNNQQPLGEFQTVPAHIEEKADTLRNNVNYYLRRLQEAQNELQAFIHQNGLSNSEWTLVIPKIIEKPKAADDATKRD